MRQAHVEMRSGVNARACSGNCEIEVDYVLVGERREDLMQRLILVLRSSDAARLPARVPFEQEARRSGEFSLKRIAPRTHGLLFKQDIGAARRAA